MQYEAPVMRSSTEILAVLRGAGSSPRERIDAVLSAIFHAESVEFAGDALLDEFSRSNHNEKECLAGLMDTFYQLRRTAYRIDESILLLAQYKKEAPTEASAIDENIDALVEYKAIFGSP